MRAKTHSPTNSLTHPPTHPPTHSHPPNTYGFYNVDPIRAIAIFNKNSFSSKQKGNNIFSSINVNKKPFGLIIR